MHGRCVWMVVMVDVCGWWMVVDGSDGSDSGCVWMMVDVSDSGDGGWMCVDGSDGGW